MRVPWLGRCGEPHSVRAAISSVIKKRLGLEVVSEKVGGERVYRAIV